MLRRLLSALVLAAAVLPRATAAQDVEMLGRRYGKQPPAAYYQEMARNPDAFRFRHGRAERMRSAAAARSSLRAVRGPAGAPGGPAGAGLGPRGEPVVGDFHVPVVLGLFDDSPATPPVTPATIQSGYFGAQPGTVSEYYAEVSSDSIALFGTVQAWVRSPMTQAQTAQGISALGCCGIGNYIKSVLALQDPGIDWGAFDNDGPDGVPNSGDDDGYVDALAVIHPTPGAECLGDWPDRIWSHKWALTYASSSHTPYQTGTPAAGGGFILVDDYFVQGAVRCGGTGLNEIGVFTHETGHAFGLPDLYDTRSPLVAHDGAGNWDLMASGSYGCSGTAPYSPCHMGAWSKAALGWVTVDTLPPDTDLGALVLRPVETTGIVYRVDAGDGSDEYFLLENRQRDVAAFDRMLPSEGLLVWQIDAGVVDARWPGNTVNSDNHMGVWLRQADGLDELGKPGGDRGDSGDPFPGSTGNTEFHSASNPASVSYEGTATGLTVIGVATAGDDVDLRVLTRFTTVTLETTGTDPGATGLFTVDGQDVPDPPGNFVSSAPFQPRSIEAAPGDSLAPGERTAFVQWDDAPSEARARVLVTPLSDTTLVASYSGLQYQLRVDLTGGAFGVTPAVVTSVPSSPDLWYAPSTAVTVTAAARTGFAFLGWTGDLSGQPNPASVTMDAPVFAGADFEVIYDVADTTIALVAATSLGLQLQVLNGTAPVTWTLLSGRLPFGVTFGTSGTLSGAALDVGSYPLDLRATDALGLQATATVTLDVGLPSIPLAQLGSKFLLGGAPLDSIQSVFLDRQGNGNGTYDLGDFRAWALANPSLPLSAALPPADPATVEERVLVLPIVLSEPEEEQR